MKSLRHRLFIVLATIIVGMLIIGCIIINLLLDPFVKDRITKEVYKSSKGLYSIQMEDLDTRFWTGTVEMEKVLLYQDSSRLKVLQTANPDENISTIKLYIPAIQIHRIRWINYLISNDLKVGKIEITSPQLLVNGSTFSEKIQKTNREFIELLPSIIAGFAGSLKIEEMKIKSGKLKYDIQTQKKIITQTAENIFLDLNDINIDTIPRKKILYSEDIHISLTNYRLETSDKLYNLGIDKISGAISDSSLEIKRIYYLKMDTINKGAKATEISIQNIKGERVNFRDLFYKKKIFIGKLLLDSANILGIIDERNSKGIAIGSIKLGSKSNFFVSPFISHLIESFTIDDIQATNGIIHNKTYSNHNIISHHADNLKLHIVKVAGIIVDSIKLKSPDHIDISFDNYEFKSNSPEIKFNVERTKASSFDSIIRLHNSRIHFKDERIKTNKMNFDYTSSLILANGFDLHALLDTGRINFKKIIITNPKSESKIITEKSPATKYISTKTNFSNLIKSWNVDRVQIINGYFKHETIASKDTVIHQSQNYNLTIKGIYATNNKKVPIISDISGEFKDYELKLRKDKLIILAEECMISSQKSEMLINNLRINQYQDQAIKENVFNTTVPDFQINQFDIKRALYKSEVAAGILIINDMKMNVYLKGGKEVKPDYAKLMPNEMARAIPIYFRIDTIKINNGLFTSMEKKNGSVIFTLNNTKVSIFNLTNDKKLMTAKNPTRLVGETLLLNEGKISFTISVPLLSTKFNCSYSGKIGPMQAEVFKNAFSYANMKAENGHIDSGSFAVTISDEIGNGNLKLVYHDFHVKALDSTGKIKKMKSIIDNFVIKNSNPNHKNEEPEIVQVSSKRETEDSIFSLLWKPLKEGVIKTVTKDTFVRQ